MDYSPEFYGNSHYKETGLHYDISGGRRLVPSLEVEEYADWNICGQFCEKGWLLLKQALILIIIVENVSLSNISSLTI